MTHEIDPLTLAVIRGRLEQIADEMDTVFERMAFSPVISDAWDRADGIYSATDGSMIVQGLRGLPIFVGTMQYTVASVIEQIEQLAPGDTYLINDPFAGGTHIMDTKLVRPFYYKGELFAFLANTGHWPDLGGRVPGGFGASASDCYQEGLRIPAVKLFKEDVLQTDIVRLVQHNSRIPEDVMGDIDAQATALRVGDNRLTELLDEYGVDTVNAVIAQLRDRSETQMRSYISDIPDGLYTFVEIMDNDGITDEPLRVDARLTIRGDEMDIDFSHSSAPCTGPMNSVKAATISSTLVAIKHVFPDIPINSGIMAPLNFNLPETVFLNAQPPRPVAGCAAETSQRIITAVMGALASAVPEMVPAGSSATVNNLSMGGTDEDGSQYVMYVFLGGGYGGHLQGDGLSNGCSLMSIGRVQSIETLEQRYPVRFNRYGLRDGSAGLGETRGGFGVHFEFELTSEQAQASLLGDQSKTPPVGRAGGNNGLPSSPWFQLDGKKVVLPMVSKGENVGLKKGDIVCLRTPGGAGYGDPAKRTQEAIARDIENGYLSSEAPAELDDALADLVQI
ncbi:hydantoinase B/oxoprolinase family protein [Arthrobacter sp. AK01]|uniref:hydantoinase B/oxoprolinase family protein n=1 Tax=Micrococcaceae TaxID=1268 RepID=UPI001E4A81B4|nr:MULTISPECIES: hydantoinase B/oxoprolinase family protein [Micrococcaceae]MCD4853128.1 hydantoinase B/oxoprolinase family protein [Arthrobacter sp. AK01]MCP1413698.1 N-methylhydantoinase B [Paenarthrobacter sp. A20]